MGSEHAMDLEELISALQPVLSRLDQCPDSLPFKQPVDPVALQIPDYFDVVKIPMDLSTINDKLVSGEYNDPWEFCDDMYLMFDNAWLYNRKHSRVYKFCTALSELFVSVFNPLMVQLGYCCGMWKRYTPLSIFCQGKPMCTIGKDEDYYCYEATFISNGSEVSEKYSYCIPCFGALPTDGITLPDSLTDKNRTVSKDQFKPQKNNVFVLEPFVDCQGCCKQFHEICVESKKQLDGFVCDRCSALGIEPKKTEHRKVVQDTPRSVQLTRGPDGKFGIIHHGALIGRVMRGSSAEENGVKRGDEIMTLNDINLENFKHEEIKKMLEEAIGTVKLLVLFNPRLLRKRVLK